MSVLWQASGAGGVKTNPNLPGGDPYALPYGEAGQAVEDQRRRSLDAMAQAGTAGRQAVVDAQTAINQKKSEAVNMALQESRTRGADQAAQDVISSRISQPYLTHSAGLDVGAASRAQDLAYRQAGDQQYFSNVAPAVQAGHDRMLGAYQRERARQDAERAAQQAQLEQQIAMAKYEAEQDRLQREWEQAQAIAEREWDQGFAEKKFGWEQSLAERKFQQDVEMAKLDASLRAQAARRSGGGGGGGGGSGSSGFLGTGMQKGELQATLPGMISTFQKSYLAQKPSAPGPGRLRSGPVTVLADLARMGGNIGARGQHAFDYLAAANLEKANQLPLGSLRAIMPKYKDPYSRAEVTAANKAPTQPSNVIYGQADNAIQGYLRQGKTPQEIIRLARTSSLYGVDPAAVNRALADTPELAGLS